MHIALMQDKFLVGDVCGNTTRILKAAQLASAQGVRLLVCPELALTAYPPTDLLLRNDFLRQVETQMDRLLDHLPRSLAVIVGAPLRVQQNIFNAAFCMQNHRIVCTYRKMQLPNYAEFDERRWFSSGSEPCIVKLDGCRCALSICEDLWSEQLAQHYTSDCADVLININASPFHIDKSNQRDAVLQARCQQTGLPIVYVNLVGGQDDLVFDGDSRFVAATGKSMFTAPAFASGLYSAHLQQRSWCCREAAGPAMQGEEKVWTALRIGLRDYFRDNRLQSAVIGLSGGIDSALSLVLTVHALGAEHVTAVMMRSRWTADISVVDAQQLAARLGVRFHQLDIDAITDCAMDSVQPALPQDRNDKNLQLAMENIQARVRGNLLMTIANSHPATAVIATGNKSEFAVGYATLYGDMAGAYAPLKDVTKSRVYALARYCNRDSEIIPQRTMDRPPSAELSANQRDQDTLPPYEVLDQVIEAFVERNESCDDMVRSGIATAERLEPLLQCILRSEHKRYQAPPGTKISIRSFGRERRYPIASGFNPRPT